MGAPTITNDGVTVAREIEVDDPFENLGVQLTKEVATKTNDVAGDGTTTATVLAQAMVHEGLRAVAAGANPMSLKRGMDLAVEAVGDALRDAARDVDDKADMAAVATVSSRDKVIGELLAEAFDKVGKDGVITVEESNTMGTELEFTEGMQFDKGYISPYFVSDAERMEAVLDDPYILVHQGKISAISDLLPLLEKVIAAGKPLFILAEDVEGEALSTLVVNKIRGTFNAAAVKAPAFGDRRKAMLQDIATLTGAQGHLPGGRPQARPGRARGARPGASRDDHQDNTTIVEGSGNKTEVEGHVNQIRPRSRTPTPTRTARAVQERLAKLADDVCVVKVGAATEVEVKEKKHRIEDAVPRRARRSRRASSPTAVPRWCTPSRCSPVTSGCPGTRRPVSASSPSSADQPLRSIAENGGVNGFVVVSKVREGKVGKGFNAATGDHGEPGRPGRPRPGGGDRSALVTPSWIRGHAAHDRDTDRREARGRRRRLPRAAATVTATATDPEHVQ